MNSKFTYIHTRIDQQQREKLSSLIAQTGMNKSELLRQLIDNAQIEQRPVLAATLTLKNDNTDAIIDQDQRAGVVSSNF